MNKFIKSICNSLLLPQMLHLKFPRYASDEDALKKSGYNVVWNEPTTNQKKQKRESEISYGFTHPLANPFQQTLQRHFFNW